MNARELKTRMAPVLLSGARRESLPKLDSLDGDDPRAPLAALSLTGQALRFENPPPPAQFAVETWPNDSRPIIANRLRTLIVRLLTTAKSSNESALALAWTFERHKLRPHPFDLPKIDVFVRGHAQYLGVFAQHWAQRDTPAERQSNYFDADQVNESNWTDAPVARRVKLLEEVRTRDAAAGRALLETVWASESADARVRLIPVLQTGLSEDDEQFLQSAVKDRAPRVRGVAQRLLARLAGKADGNPALAACLERIQKSKTGLLKKRAALKLELPATVKEHTVNRWVQEQFADVMLDEFAFALEIPVSDLAAASKEDSNLLFGLSLMATREKQFKVLSDVVDQLPDAWGRMAEVGFDDVSFVHSQERERWVESTIRPRDWMPQLAVPVLGWLLRRIGEPLPFDLMREMIGSKWWREQIEANPGPEWVQCICALCPMNLRNTLREQLEPLDAARKDAGLLLLEILDKLEMPNE